ncbi:alpha/beta hydrolase [Mycobacterium sp. 050134]|uniref:alpha/beta hydrolase n=1 Tax=Mycobacterium sp. 050134 TaxID=3096111 RepID=UPI002ED9E47C
MAAPRKHHPVVFIHGLWIHSAAWGPWLELFESCGYSASAPGWPGDGPTVAETRRNAAALNDVGIGEIVQHYAGLIHSSEPRPIVVGHSFGGLIAQLLLDSGLAAAAAAIDPAPIKGVKVVPLAQVRSGFPILGHPRTRHKTVALNPKQFHYAFGNTLSRQESDALHAAVSIPGPGRPLFQGAAANFSRHSPAKVDVHNTNRGPLLLTSGTDDHVVPLKVTKATHRLYAKAHSDTDLHLFKGRGHSLTIDNGWKGVADVVLQWLARKGL